VSPKGPSSAQILPAQLRIISERGGSPSRLFPRSQSLAGLQPRRGRRYRLNCSASESGWTAFTINRRILVVIPLSLQRRRTRLQHLGRFLGY
jgi:hypothetical protein